MHISCKSCTKNEAFLQDIKNLARILQEKLQDNFLARFWSNLARKLFYIFLAKILQDFYILQEKLYFYYKNCKICARFNARSCKKNSYLQDLHISCKTVFSYWEDSPDSIFRGGQRETIYVVNYRTKTSTKTKINSN